MANSKKSSSKDEKQSAASNDQKKASTLKYHGPPLVRWPGISGTHEPKKWDQEKIKMMIDRHPKLGRYFKK